MKPLSCPRTVSTDERRRGERAGVLRTVVVASEKDQSMIESGAGAVYEAIVRRKSRAAIWRAARGLTARQTGRLAGHPAEISAWAPGEFRNLGQPGGQPFPQTKQIPYKSMH
ncbi:MAG: hypothetical protein LBJ65_03590 [Burkholderia sp.]|jgi:hypothetical protein|uniref:hypothetical protein n=1 Tax=Burkholderia sp. TaxID=36773 RepID=UPI00282DDD93|nr:hypothetical protein [Burkholderia sp.]MDR0240665.1 hypothetical protein [Burkholderia sp.]